MKLQYHITPTQIQNLTRSLQADQRGEKLPSHFFFYADIKIYGETVAGTYLDLPHISLLGLLREIRNFLQSDKTSETIYGWWEEQYEIKLSMPRSTSMLALGPPPPPGIKITPFSPKMMSQIMQTFTRGYIRHVPQLASYSGMRIIEEEFDFKAVR